MGSRQPDSVLEKSKRYSFRKYSLRLLEMVYLFVMLFVFLGSGASDALAGRISGLAPNNYLAVSLYVLVVFLAYYLFNFPINFHLSYRLEHEFQLSNQKCLDWLKDEFKTGIVSYAVGLIIIAAFYYALGHFVDYWWLAISFFWISFSFIFANLAPVIIIPLFFKYTRISDEELRQRIMRLAERMKVRILDVFEIDLSSKTLKANAAFLGWGATRRVILADTLKNKYSQDEIEVILAHEFAHFKLKHLLKLILINSAATTVLFYVIFKTSGYVLRFFNLFSLSDIAALPVLFIYFNLFEILTKPLMNFFSRQMEKNADSMALKISPLKEAFISMMDKLANQNLADRNPHPLIRFYFFSHPAIDERIAMARSMK